MADLRDDDLFLVNRNDESATVQQSELMAELREDDYMIVNREDVTYKITGADLIDSVIDPLTLTPVVTPPNPQIGDLLTVDPNTAGGKSPFSYTYQWKYRTSIVDPIQDYAGETEVTYQTVSSDEGLFIACEVTVTDSRGTEATALSAFTAAVIKPPSIVKPSIIAPADGAGEMVAAESDVIINVDSNPVYSAEPTTGTPWSADLDWPAVFDNTLDTNGAVGSGYATYSISLTATPISNVSKIYTVFGDKTSPNPHGVSLNGTFYEFSNNVTGGSGWNWVEETVNGQAFNVIVLDTPITLTNLENTSPTGATALRICGVGNPGLVVDGAATLVVASDKELDQFNPLDDVQQDSGYTPETSAITNVDPIAVSNVKAYYSATRPNNLTEVLTGTEYDLTKANTNVVENSHWIALVCEDNCPTSGSVFKSDGGALFDMKYSGGGGNFDAVGNQLDAANNPPSGPSDTTEVLFSDGGTTGYIVNIQAAYTLIKIINLGTLPAVSDAALGQEATLTFTDDTDFENFRVGDLIESSGRTLTDLTYSIGMGSFGGSGVRDRRAKFESTKTTIPLSAGTFTAATIDGAILLDIGSTQSTLDWTFTGGSSISGQWFASNDLVNWVDSGIDAGDGLKRELKDYRYWHYELNTNNSVNTFEGTLIGVTSSTIFSIDPINSEMTVRGGDWSNGETVTGPDTTPATGTVSRAGNGTLTRVIETSPIIDVDASDDPIYPTQTVTQSQNFVTLQRPSGVGLLSFRIAVTGPQAPAYPEIGFSPTPFTGAVYKDDVSGWYFNDANGGTGAFIFTGYSNGSGVIGGSVTARYVDDGSPLVMDDSNRELEFIVNASGNVWMKHQGRLLYAGNDSNAPEVDPETNTAPLILNVPQGAYIGFQSRDTVSATGTLNPLVVKLTLTDDTDLENFEVGDQVTGAAINVTQYVAGSNDIATASSKATAQYRIIGSQLWSGYPDDNETVRLGDVFGDAAWNMVWWEHTSTTSGDAVAVSSRGPAEEDTVGNWKGLINPAKYYSFSYYGPGTPTDPDYVTYGPLGTDLPTPINFARTVPVLAVGPGNMLTVDGGIWSVGETVIGPEKTFADPTKFVIELSESDESGSKRWISNAGKFVRGEETPSQDAAPEVSGVIDVTPETDEIVEYIKNLGYIYSDGVRYSGSSITQYDQATLLEESTYPRTNAFDGDEGTTALYLGSPGVRLYIKIPFLNPSDTLEVMAGYYNPDDIYVNDVLTSVDGAQSDQPPAYITIPHAGGDVTVSIIGALSNSPRYNAVKVNGSILIDGQDIYKLAFASDKDLSRFNTDDVVRQDSGHTLQTSAITNQSQGPITTIPSTGGTFYENSGYTMNDFINTAPGQAITGDYYFYSNTSVVLNYANAQPGQVIDFYFHMDGPEAVTTRITTSGEISDPGIAAENVSPPTNSNVYPGLVTPTSKTGPDALAWLEDENISKKKRVRVTLNSTAGSIQFDPSTGYMYCFGRSLYGGSNVDLTFADGKDLENFRIGDVASTGQYITGTITIRRASGGDPYPTIYNYNVNGSAVVGDYNDSLTGGDGFTIQGDGPFANEATTNSPANRVQGDSIVWDTSVSPVPITTLTIDMINGSSSAGGTYDVLHNDVLVGQINYPVNASLTLLRFDIGQFISPVNYVTDIGPGNTMTLDGGTWNIGQTVIGPNCLAATGVVGSVDVPAKTITLTLSDETGGKRWIVNSGKTVLGPTIQVPSNLKLYSSDFLADPEGTLAHTQSDWQITLKTDVNYSSPVSQSLNDSDDLTVWEPSNLEGDTAYRCRVRHKSNNVVSEWSDDSTFKTASDEDDILVNPGPAYVCHGTSLYAVPGAVTEFINGFTVGDTAVYVGVDGKAYWSKSQAGPPALVEVDTTNPGCSDLTGSILQASSTWGSCFMFMDSDNKIGFSSFRSDLVAGNADPMAKFSGNANRILPTGQVSSVVAIIDDAGLVWAQNQVTGAWHFGSESYNDQYVWHNTGLNVPSGVKMVASAGGYYSVSNLVILSNDGDLYTVGGTDTRVTDTPGINWNAGTNAAPIPLEAGTKFTSIASIGSFGARCGWNAIDEDGNKWVSSAAYTVSGGSYPEQSWGIVDSGYISPQVGGDNSRYSYALKDDNLIYVFDGAYTSTTVLSGHDGITFDKLGGTVYTSQCSSGRGIAVIPSNL